MSIDVALADHVATITINRPERMNAMDHEHYAALSAAPTSSTGATRAASSPSSSRATASEP